MNKTVLISKIKKQIELLGESSQSALLAMELCGNISEDKADVRPLTLRAETVWGGARKSYDLRGQFRARGGGDNEIVLCMELGRSASLESLSFLYGPEATAYIDGELMFGIDPNHSVWPLPQRFADGEPHELRLIGWTGIKEELYKVGFLGLAIRSKTLERYTQLLSVCLEAAQNIAQAQLEQALLKAAYDSLLRLEPWAAGTIPEISVPLAELERSLKGIPYIPIQKVTACGHGHLDLAWLWTTSIAEGKGMRTFSNVLSLMETHRDFHYSQTQAQLYRWMEERAPRLIESIKAMVSAGRWEILGGMWVEPDCNITGGESLIRQLLLFETYMMQTFGTTGSPVAWLPDTFGFPAQLPQMLKSAGIDYFATAKLTWNQYNKMPDESFVWRGLDGSTLLCHIVSTSKPKWWGATYSADLSAEELLATAAALPSERLGRHDFLVAYGMGDGGGGPSEEMLLRAELMKQGIPGLPAVNSGTFQEFFRELSEETDLPEWEGDLYLELHRGTYTNQSDTKRRNRLCEAALHRAEFLLSWAWDAAESPYPARELETLWRLQCLNQFHDILPGSAIHRVYLEEKRDHERILAECGAFCENAVRALGKLIQRDAVCVVVNSGPYDWSGTLRASAGAAGTALSCAAHSVPSFCVDNEYYMYVENVPAYGFAALNCEGKAPCALYPEKVRLAATDISLENSKAHIFFDENGEISAWLDKDKGRELVAPGGRMAQWRLYEDVPGDWDAWDIDENYQEKGFARAKLVSAYKYTLPGVAQWLMLEKEIGASRIFQRIELADREARIDCSCRLVWGETHRMLRLVSQTNIHSDGTAAYGTQFGTVRHPTHYNTAWDRARFENCMHGWADLSEGDYAIAIASDCKYGIDIHGGTINLAIQRGACFPDETAEKGEHLFKFSLVPHAADSGTEARRAAYALIDPPTAYDMSGSCGELTRGAMLSVNSDRLVVETVKQAQTQDGIIVRAYETGNTRGQCELNYYRELSSCFKVNVLEKHTAEAEFGGQSAVLNYRPYEIINIKLAGKEMD